MQNPSKSSVLATTRIQVLDKQVTPLTTYIISPFTLHETRSQLPYMGQPCLSEVVSPASVDAVVLRLLLADFEVLSPAALIES